MYNAKNVDILTTSLHSLTKFLDISAKSFFPCANFCYLCITLYEIDV